MGAELFQTIGGLFASVLVLGFIVGIATCRRTSVGSGGASVAFIVNGLSSFFNAKHASALASGVAMIAIPTIAVADVDKRVALVIGNGAYLNAPKLDNPTFDARAVADEFRKLGFQVVDGYDLDIAQMREKVSEFSAALPGAKSAVIYYAGHGVSVDEENYLIPIDIVLRSPTDLDLGAISVPLILRQMKREDRVNVVILDACRDNPFAAALAKNRTRAIIGERGLSRIDGDLARGTLIAFASDPKSTALDGPAGQHSPFTSALLDHIADPGVSIDTVMSRVRTEVWEKTNHNQLPWVNTSLIGDYRLNPQTAPEAAADATKAPASPVATGDRHRQEDLLWESAQHSNLSADYQAYLDAFPNGMFSQMARNRIAVLQDAGASGAAKVPESIAARAPEKVALAEPAAPSEKDWKAEIGSAETEKALDLTSADQKEIQQRLIALQLYKGPATGAFDAPTRSAIAAWQKKDGVAATSYLGSMQLAALRAESDTEYQRYLAAQSAPRQAPKQAIKPIKAEPKRALRSTKPAARRLTKRSSPPTEAAATTPDPGGTPEWRRRAGLPVDDAPGPRGPPPAFWQGAATGAAAGLLLGGFRRY